MRKAVCLCTSASCMYKFGHVCFVACVLWALWWPAVSQRLRQSMRGSLRGASGVRAVQELEADNEQMARMLVSVRQEGAAAAQARDDATAALHCSRCEATGSLTRPSRTRAGVLAVMPHANTWVTRLPWARGVPVGER